MAVFSSIFMAVFSSLPLRELASMIAQMTVELSSAAVPVMYPRWETIKRMEVSEKQMKHGVGEFSGEGISALCNQQASARKEFLLSLHKYKSTSRILHFESPVRSFLLTSKVNSCCVEITEGWT